MMSYPNPLRIFSQNPAVFLLSVIGLSLLINSGKVQSATVSDLLSTKANPHNCPLTISSSTGQTVGCVVRVTTQSGNCNCTTTGSAFYFSGNPVTLPNVGGSATIAYSTDAVQLFGGVCCANGQSTFTLILYPDNTCSGTPICSTAPSCGTSNSFSYCTGYKTPNGGSPTTCPTTPLVCS